ncbi:MAG: DHH family phosphoesterase [Saprospiraceae bacterium]|nr:DHH family phosphoesterase [Saprospiraceae bacterium]
MEDIQQIRDLLAYPKDIIVFSHRNPDGDAMGSSIGVKLYLEKLGHKVDIIFPSEFPSILTFLPRTDDIVIYDFEKERALELIKRCQLMFFLDFSSLDRIDALGEHVISKNVPKIHIDHHLDPEPFADFVFSDVSSSSTSELVYRFFRLFNNCIFLDEKIAECLLTGIISDTGSFKYSASSETFQIASKLMEEGVDIAELQNNIYNSLSDKQLKLIGYSINQKMELIPEYDTAIMALSKQDYKEYEIQRGDTEGLVNYMLMMKNVRLAALITEQPTIVKISLRSKGDLSVQEIVKKHFKGGGHKNAAGGQAFAKLEDVVSRFKAVLPQYVHN